MFWIGLGIVVLAMLATASAARAAPSLRIGRVLELGGRKLTVPIQYTIEEKFPGIVLYAAEFDAWGSGSNMYSALTELTSTLLQDARDLLVATDDVLTPEAAQRKRRFKQLLRW